MISFRLIKQDIKVNLISLEYPAFYKYFFTAAERLWKLSLSLSF